MGRVTFDGTMVDDKPAPHAGEGRMVMKHETAQGTAMQKAPETTPTGRESLLPNYTFEPMTYLQRFGEEMDRVFSNFGFGRRFDLPRMFTRMEVEPFFAEADKALWTPKIEVLEKEGKLCVRADLPGVRKEDINIEVRDNTLFIKGERKHEHEEKKEGLFRSEKTYGSFFRAMRLPEGVDFKKVKADLKDGVLNVMIDVPVREEAKPRKIEIA